MANPSCIQLLSDGLVVQKFHPEIGKWGWYFSDEGQIFRGPYASLIDCANARDEYIEVLMTGHVDSENVFFTETTSPAGSSGGLPTSEGGTS